MKSLLTLFVSAVALATTSGCSVVGIRLYEQPDYVVLRNDGSIELRDYGPLVVVETEESGNRGETEEPAFWRLFRYISGANDGEREISMTAPVMQEAEPTKIDMTAPVLQVPTESGWRMAFVLPKEYTLANAPQPTDPTVRLREIPRTQVAAIRFSGLRTDAKHAKKTEELRDWLTDNEIVATSEPRYAGYDPPFTLWFLRRNEVLIDTE